MSKFGVSQVQWLCCPHPSPLRMKQVEKATRVVLTLSNALSQEDLSKFVRLCFDYPLTGQAKEKVRLVPTCCSRILYPC